MKVVGLTSLKNRIRDWSNAINLAPSRRPPFVTRRYSYRGRRRMLEALGPELSAAVCWPVLDTPAPDGEMASIFAATHNVHKFLHYLPIYESSLRAFRPRSIRMMEVGVARGGSLQMWRRYLHPESVIVGIDIDARARRFDDPAQRVHIRIGGQQDIGFLQSVVSELGPFDVILDDG